MRMSFLTSVVDGTDFLDQMLASLVAQTFKDFELVLVIDKPDKLKIESGLIDIAEGYRKHFPIKVIKNRQTVSKFQRRYTRVKRKRKMGSQLHQRAIKGIARSRTS